MALYAISDLHLAFSTDKPMDIFGEKWYKHDEKIKKNWMDKVKEEDLVLIAGDISWSMKAEESKSDLDFIDSLPGKKIISKGNHDYWWQGITKLNKMYENTKFLQNNFYTYKDYAICGSRAWICPGTDRFTEKDKKIYERELIRLKLSLDSAKNSGYTKFIVMIHYPPTNEKHEDSAFTELFKEYGVDKVIYGHLHGPSLGNVINGERDGVEYIMTSCDYINFDPKLILE
ncbi:metallophosphoesterase [Clostridium septicum]|uniref:Metallophosphoesterase n=1 Tax=Clostridium septicum TaxID=1504 RepID=A0A9N7PJJ7_CLOSE|nr:metallophosphoesterase [Clostridium septicum]AYE34916.1 serine/threonine protein phosphatase [Clostridium septicum]MDU1313865.1 metallophosphoesterase [Clostridium septicum]QAS60310.1 serine/threonine protein phosphatase [Clostridium septicum]UEC20435.1 metallophosphoesterase [Clostridium septicum]USS01508.1 metallophosphoesterase [Clostridium septicum]